jgi:hypothetical protein
MNIFLDERSQTRICYLIMGLRGFEYRYLVSLIEFEL